MKNITKILFGVAAVVFGLIFLGDALQFWDMGAFHGWWTLFLIVPAIGNMLSSRVNLFNIALLVVGVWLLIGEQGWIDSEMLNKIALSAGLLMLGLWLIFSDMFKKNKINSMTVNNDLNSGEKSEPAQNAYRRDDFQTSDNDFPSFLSIFSLNQSRNSSRNLKGGNATVLFGGLELDLRDAVPCGNVTFNVTAIFGGADIIPPSGYKIETTGISLIGGCDNKVIITGSDNMPVFTIKFFTLCGGINVVDAFN